MQIQFLGVGEAFDEQNFNTSLSLRTPDATLLLDCGYAIPAQTWYAGLTGDTIDLVYISHAHADHYFGLPALFGRMWEEGRTKPLVLMSQESVLDKVDETLEQGYAGLRTRFRYPIERLPVAAGKVTSWNGFRFSFAPTRHSSDNLAVRMESGGQVFCYSGDGAATPESVALCRGSDALVHEAYAFEETAVHGDIPGVLRLAAEGNVRTLALVHLQRGVRRERSRVIEALEEARDVKALLPEPLDFLDV